MFILRSIRALDVHKWWIRLDNPTRHQIVELRDISKTSSLDNTTARTHPKQIFVLSQAVQIPPTERQRPKILIYDVQQALRGRNPQVNSRGIDILRIVARLHIIMHISLASTAERLDRKRLALLHLRLVGARLDYRNRFTAVDLVLIDIVPIQIANRLNMSRLPIQRDFITRHDLLNRRTNIAHPHINPRLPNPRIRRILDRRKQVVVFRIKAHRERRVHYPSIHMHPEINLHDILRLEHDLVSRIRRIMRRAVIYAQTRREAHSSNDVIALLQSLMPRQRSHAILDHLGNLRQCLPGFDVSLCILPHLAVDLSALAVFLQEVVVHAVEMALFFIRCAICVVIFVLYFLADGIFARGKELGDWHARRSGLRCCGCCGGGGAGLLLLAGLALFLLFRGGGAVGGVGGVFVVVGAIRVAVGIVVLLVTSV